MSNTKRGGEYRAGRDPGEKKGPGRIKEEHGQGKRPLVIQAGILEKGRQIGFAASASKPTRKIHGEIPVHAPGQENGKKFETKNILSQER